MNSHIIFDDVFEFGFRQHLYSFFMKSAFYIGWSDREDIIPSCYKYLHSNYSLQDLENCAFLSNIKNVQLNKFLKNKKVQKSIVNLSHPSNVFFPHSHINHYSLIYYANIDWHPHWHGETIIYEQNAKDIEKCVPYIPNRVLLLNKGIVHSLRPPSTACPEYRITFACFLEDV